MAFTDRLANRGSVSTGYNIDNSCVFEGGNNEWVYLNSPTAGNRDIFTFSFWFKRSESKDAIVVWQGTHGRIRFQSDDIRLRFDNGHELETTRKIRDYSAWYHLVIACDSTQGTAANRVKMYVNGVQETAFETATYPDQNDDSALMTTDNLYLSAGDGDFDYSGYIADFCIIDGTQYAASDFGEFDEDSGIWKPKDLSGLTFGSEGVWLKFDDSSSMGADSSGNSNNFTLTNIAAINQTTDTPTNNFCTWNPVNLGTSGVDTWTITEGATELTRASSGWSHYFGTIPVSKGKWYWEAEYQNMAYSVFGFHDVDAIISGEPTTGFGGFVNYNGGEMRVDGLDNETTNNYGTIADNSIIGVALNMDDNQVTIYINNTATVSNFSIGNSANKTVVPYVRLHAASAASCSTNFGSAVAYGLASAEADENGYGSFEFAPPSGYYAICTKNLAEFG